MHVAETGSGRPLIFLHGWSCHGGFFAPQAAALQSGYRILQPDLPGHRHSPSSLPELTIPALAEALHRLITERRLEDAVLVGWSMGALVAFDYIARHGEDGLGGLVVIDMTPKITNDTGWSLGIRNGFDAGQSMAAVLAMQADWPAYAHAFLPRIFARSGCRDRALHDWAAGEILNNDAAAMAALWGSMAEADYRWLMPRLALPSLILHGSESQLYPPEVSLWLETAIRGARRFCIEGAGHAPQLEMPAAFNACLADFLAGLPVRTAAAI